VSFVHHIELQNFLNAPRTHTLSVCPGSIWRLSCSDASNRMYSFDIWLVSRL